VPFYPDQSRMTQASDVRKLYCDVDYRRFSVGGYVIAVQRDTDNSILFYDVAEIAAIDVDGLQTTIDLSNTYSKGDDVYPAMLCYPSFGSDTKSNLTRARGSISLDAEEVYDSSALSLENATYTPTLIDSLPVYDFRINEAEPMDITVSYQGEKKESGRGYMTYQQDDYSYSTFDITSVAISREEYWELIGFFNYLRGRGRPFWIKNYSDFIEPVATASTYIDVDDMRIVDWQNLRYLWVEDASGSYDIVTISDITDTGSVFRITFPEPSITPTKYYQAYKARLDSDEIEENWFTDSVVEFTFTVRELQGA